jgi:hypothetical protein
MVTALYSLSGAYNVSSVRPAPDLGCKILHKRRKFIVKAQLGTVQWFFIAQKA